MSSSVTFCLKLLSPKRPKSRSCFDLHGTRENVVESIAAIFGGDPGIVWKMLRILRVISVQVTFSRLTES